MAKDTKEKNIVTIESDFRELTKMYNDRQKLISSKDGEFENRLKDFDAHLNSFDERRKKLKDESTAKFYKKKDLLEKEKQSINKDFDSKRVKVLEDIEKQNSNTIKKLEADIKEYQERTKILEGRSKLDLDDVVKKSVIQYELIEDKTPTLKEQANKKLENMKELKQLEINKIKEKIKENAASVKSKAARIKENTEKDIKSFEANIARENKRFDADVTRIKKNLDTSLKDILAEIDAGEKECAKKTKKIAEEADVVIKQKNDQLQAAKITGDYRLEKFVLVELEYREEERDRKIKEVENETSAEYLEQRMKVMELSKQFELEKAEIEKARVQVIQDIENEIRKAHQNEEYELKVLDVEIKIKELELEKDLTHTKLRYDLDMESVGYDLERDLLKVSNDLEVNKIEREADVQYANIDNDIALHSIETEVKVMGTKIELFNKILVLEKEIENLKINTEKDITVRRNAKDIDCIDHELAIDKADIDRKLATHQEELLHEFLNSFAELLTKRSEEELEINSILIENLQNIKIKRMKSRIDTSKSDWAKIQQRMREISGSVTVKKGKENNAASAYDSVDSYFTDLSLYYKQVHESYEDETRELLNHASETNSKVTFFAQKVKETSFRRLEREKLSLMAEFDENTASHTKIIEDIMTEFETYEKDLTKSLRNDIYNVEKEKGYIELSFDSDINNIRKLHSKYASTLNQRKDHFRIETDKLIANNAKSADTEYSAIAHRVNEYHRTYEFSYNEAEKNCVLQQNNLLNEKIAAERALTTSQRESDKKEQVQIHALTTEIITDCNQKIDDLKREALLTSAK